MASASTKAAKQGPPIRRLAELLTEQQDPFVLEIYLLERGYRSRSKHSNSSSSSSSSTGEKFSNVARILKKKLVSINQVIVEGLKNVSLSSYAKRSANNDKGIKKSMKHKEEGAEESDRWSSASSSAICNTCSGSDIDRESVSSSPSLTNLTHEVAPERVISPWRIVEENKQCSPISVLDQIDFHQTIPVFNVRQYQETPSASRMKLEKKLASDSILSASLWELLIDSRAKKKPKQLLGSCKEFPTHYVNSKKALQQTKQLLFDCVREVVEISHNNEMRQQQQQQQRSRRKREKGLMMGAEEIGKLICKNLKTWGKLSFSVGGGTNVNKLLKMDLLDGGLVEEEWGGLEACKKEVILEVGDALVEEIMDGLVQDMIDQS